MKTLFKIERREKLVKNITVKLSNSQIEGLNKLEKKYLVKKTDIIRKLISDVIKVENINIADNLIKPNKD